LRIRQNEVCRLLGIESPILQAGMPWISNPGLVAAVSNAGGLGLLHLTAEMAPDDEPVAKLRENIRQARRMTSKPFGVAFYLPHPQVTSLMDAAVEEGMRIAVTYAGSPGLYTGYLKDRDVKVLHQVALVRHARSAESQGVDCVIGEGYEGGGPRGSSELSTLVLVPQMVDAVSIPVIASGGIVDARGFVAALALGAQGVQMGTRFIATEQCIAHQRYKEALLAGIDTGTVIAGRYQWPTRLLRTDVALQARDEVPRKGRDTMEFWESHLGLQATRASLLEGDLDAGLAYAGSGLGLVSEIMDAGDVVRTFMEQAERILSTRR